MKHQIKVEPQGTILYCEGGSILLNVLQQGGFMLDATCGGRGRCGKCKVWAESDEWDGKKEILSCTTAVNSDLLVTLPVQEKFLDRKSMLLKTHTFPVELNLTKKFLKVKKASIEDGKGDVERILAELKLDRQVNLAVTKQAMEILAKSKEGITVVFDDQELIAIEQGDTTNEFFGIAFDIGTTTVVGSLCDLITGKVLVTVSATNPQRQHGGDVISRITYANEGAGNTEKLQEEIVACLNEIINKLCKEAKVCTKHIYCATVVGNTCMHHLLLGLNPTQLAIAPYVPVVQRELRVNPEEIGLKINKQGSLYVLPNIAGFVGADTVGVILATGLERVSEPTLAVDLGTNGEIVLNSGHKMVACSTAAGPAFEGAQITYGMRAAEGAIEKVEINNGTFKLKVIGNSKVKGICGSGLIDLIAQLLKHGVIDPSGRIVEPDLLSSDMAFLMERLRSNGKSYDFVLAFPEESLSGEPIVLKQKDVRELQLAKGAILTGIRMLLREVGLNMTDLKQVYLAGAFGNYVEVESVLGIGLFPAIPASRIKAIGNGAGIGAIKALLSDQEKERAELLAKNIIHLELASKPEFQDEFIQSLRFPVQTSVE
ncbi:MAG TPA: DUF4445 domain-containing protein [Clostridia bacterium]|jgi:uncharacterized 2Fe-2S/4Fe-4S cluster protein (DUF4445 family)|nr:DUF4445 domain-containing protein [Clostridia bacterium]